MRARTRGELLEQGNLQYEALAALVDSFTPDQQVTMTVFDNRAIKDGQAHLHDWHQLVFPGRNRALRGAIPVMPYPGYSWKDVIGLDQPFTRSDLPSRGQLDQNGSQRLDARGDVGVVRALVRGVRCPGRVANEEHGRRDAGLRKDARVVPSPCGQPGR